MADAFQVHSLAAAKPKRPRRSPRQAKVAHHMKVDRRVWQTAVAAANGDPSRIVIEPDGSVTIRNRGRAS